MYKEYFKEEKENIFDAPHKKKWTKIKVKRVLCDSAATTDETQHSAASLLFAAIFDGKIQNKVCVYVAADVNVVDTALITHVTMMLKLKSKNVLGLICVRWTTENQI